jgi:hypothetical protein
MNRSLMPKVLLCGAIAAVAALAQYKAEPTGAPPADVPAAYTAVLEKAGTKITGPNGEYADIWLVAAAPTGPDSGEQNVTLPTVPHGSLMGIIRFPNAAKDRRGQQVKPGIYTLRYSMFPINGDHQGVAPQRDFFILSRISDDPDPKSTPAFDPLMELSKKAAGTPHPLVMSIWKADDQNQNFTQQGDDWVLQRKMGDVNLAIVLVGTASA